MTAERLDYYYHLRRTIADSERKIGELRLIASSIGTGDMDGMPHGSGGVKDKVGGLVASIFDAETELAELRHRADTIGAEVETWIRSIDSVYARLVLRCRYHKAWPWKTIAARLGGNASANKLCKLAMRYVPR